MGLSDRVHHPPSLRELRPLLITLGVLVALLVIVRIVLDPLVAHFARRQLNEGEGFRGTFAGLHVSIVPPAITVRRLKVIEHPGGDWDAPVYYFEESRVSVLWRETLRGHLVADAVLRRPKIVMKSHEEAAAGKKTKSINEQLAAMLPLRVDRLEVDGGELLIARGSGQHAPELWLHDAYLVAENLATRKALAEGEPSRMEGRARVQRSGKLTLSFAMDPWAKGLTFNGKAALRGLELAELYAFTADRTDLRATQGSIDLFADLRARGGALSGGVKPVLINVEVKSASKDLGAKLKAALADAAIHLASNTESGERKVATVIPIKGTVSDAHPQMVPTILGVVRNAFVEGLAGSFAELPPPTAEKKQGIVKQALNALKKGHGQPEAQPESPRAGRKGRR